VVTEESDWTGISPHILSGVSAWPSESAPADADIVDVTASDDMAFGEAADIVTTRVRPTTAVFCRIFTAIAVESANFCLVA
jgi:hypothetical protein